MTEVARPVNRGRVVLFVLIALGGAAFDLGSKSFMFSWVGPPGSPPKAVVDHILELRTNYNPGALWGLGKNWPHSSLLFAGLSIGAALAICYWLFFRGGAADRRLTVALGLITAGALGNCYDRLALGQVRDFVHFHVDSVHFNFAIFNFADNMLVVGAIILMLLALRPEPSEPESKADVPKANAEADELPVPPTA